MNKILVFLLILSVAATANGFHVLALYVALLGIIIAIVALIPLWKKSRKIVDLYLGMPTVWQNIQETLELGIKFGFLTKITRVSCIREFYGWMKDNDDLFEIKVDERLVKALDSEYGKELPLQGVPVPAMIRALYYCCYISTKNPERLPEVLNVVQVRKKVQGKKQDLEKKVSEELRPIYA